MAPPSVGNPSPGELKVFGSLTNCQTPAPSRFLLPRRQGQGQAAPGGGPGGANPSASQFGATPRFATSSAAPAPTPSSSARNPPLLFTPAAPPSSRRQLLHELIDSSPPSLPDDDKRRQDDRREFPDQSVVRPSGRRAAAAAQLIVEDFDDDEESRSEWGGDQEEHRSFSSQYDGSNNDDDDARAFERPPKRRRITISPEPPPLSVRPKVGEDDIITTSDLSGGMDSASDDHGHYEPHPDCDDDGYQADQIMQSLSDRETETNGNYDYDEDYEDEEKGKFKSDLEEDSDLDLFRRERRHREPNTPSKKRHPTFHRAPRFVAAEQPTDEGGPGRPQLQIPADAFSPKRRRGGAKGADYLPGGLAAEVRGWLLHVAPRAADDAPGGGLAPSVAAAARVVVEEVTGSRGMWMVRARRVAGDGEGGEDADGHIRIILSGDGRISGLGASNRVTKGAVVAAYPPTWEVEMQGQGTWTMVCDWSMADGPS